jgi:hypothetical protein
MRGAYTVLVWGDLRERDHFKEVGEDVKIILKLISKNWDMEYGPN